MADEQTVPHFNVRTVPFAPMPQFGGAQALLYRSDDGRRVAGTFRESGSHTLTMEYDEFLFVVTGRVIITAPDGERLELTVGDVCYLRQGQKIGFEMSDDFQDVAVLVSDMPIEVLDS